MILKSKGARYAAVAILCLAPLGASAQEGSIVYRIARWLAVEAAGKYFTDMLPDLKKTGEDYQKSLEELKRELLKQDQNSAAATERLNAVEAELHSLHLLLSGRGDAASQNAFRESVREAERAVDRLEARVSKLERRVDDGFAHNEERFDEIDQRLEHMQQIQTQANRAPPPAAQQNPATNPPPSVGGVAAMPYWGPQYVGVPNPAVVMNPLSVYAYYGVTPYYGRAPAVSYVYSGLPTVRYVAPRCQGCVPGYRGYPAPGYVPPRTVGPGYVLRPQAATRAGVQRH